MNLFDENLQLKKNDPTTTKAWEKLQEHYKEIKLVHVRELFKKNPERFNQFSLRFGDVLYDYSKNIITAKTMELLFELAEEVELKDAIKKMFGGEKINETENRSVLHTALRHFSEEPVFYEKEDVVPQVKEVQEKIRKFSEKIISGLWLGYSGKPITDIVNIGIGGSDLGPFMVAGVLKPYNKININSHFVSNIDGTHIIEILDGLNPETTLFMIASKTFITVETMTNANTAKKWFLSEAVKEEMMKQHFVAISTNEEKVKEFGIDPQNMFVFWDWVGGRFSLWSAIGLSIACTIGYENFQELLQGAHEMDLHFKNTSFEKNIPVIFALLGIWYTNFFGAQTEAIIPYDQYLHRFISYMQQLNMESNGKSIDRNGKKINYETGPVIWGKPGTNGQHAFFQLLHQGTKIIPCDFIAAAISKNPVGDHHQILLANFFAQTEALMMGKNEEQVKMELKEAGKSKDEMGKLIPYKIFEGNRPSNTILMKQITPYNLGSLIAMYEHKIFVQGIIWNIFSFDQWGVELGKQLAGNILEDLKKKTKSKTHDASTNGLINTFKEFSKDAPMQNDSDLDHLASHGLILGSKWTSPQITELHHKLLTKCMEKPHSSQEMADALLRHGKSGNLKRAISSLRNKKYLAYTIPEIPNSSKQKHKITRKGIKALEQYNQHKKATLNRIQIIKGDITNLKVDAIVNAANTSLMGGGGVDGAIHRAAGEELLRECRNLGGCPTGEARITGAYQLQAKFVIHTVGPVWHGGKTRENQLLANCYKNSLDLAVKNVVRTIAFPAISCGVYRFPVDKAAQIAVEEVKKFLEVNSTVEKVIFSCFNDKIYNAYLDAIQNIF